MGKIKMNLDMLEEVRMQHEIAREATEAVINKGRADLNSMTEEVWEGEDGDMAREQLHDLLNKEMTQTWKELDTLHEVIKKAQKSAYEAKNFCNNFPQIFRNGSMPSDTDSSPCSGDLMCNNESCEALKNSMSEASKNASNIKSKVIDVESLLAELETAEAKFDYSSYTEPIKTQAQNVIDRVDIFNNAVTKYEHNVDRLDQTFAKELLASTPDTVPTPFDPSILLTDDIVHMNDGDIINFLEAHDLIDIGGKLSDAQLENILAMLFDKKDVDVSGLSKEDFEVAFLNLPEEKQKAILLEMGLSRSQIDSILESKESKRTIIDQFCNSKTKDRINELRNNNPFSPKATSKTNSSQGTTAPPTGGTKQSGNSTGAVECDSQTIGSPGKIDPSFFPSYAEQLIEAQNALCDDDPSNDEEAMKTINECLTAGLYFENNTLYYNEEYLQYCKEMAGEGSLLYSLLDQFDEIVLGEEGTISSFGDSGTCSLTISQLGAGYQLLLNADSKIIGGEYSNYRVAYAATEETCKHYFMNGDEYDWDKIQEWCQKDDPVIDAEEYAFLSNELLNMNRDDINKFLRSAETSTFSFTDRVSYLMVCYDCKAKEEAIIQGKDEIYTRALCCSTVVNTLRTYPGYIFEKIEFEPKGFEDTGAYKAFFTNPYNFFSSDYLMVFPSENPSVIGKRINDFANDIIDPSLVDGIKSWGAGNVSTVLQWSTAKTIVGSIILSAKDYIESYKTFNVVKEGFKLGEAASMYGVGGNLIIGSLGFNKIANVIVDSYDEMQIGAATIMYNRNAKLASAGVATVMNGDTYDYITRTELKESFSEENSDIFENYYDLFYSSNIDGAKEIERIEGILHQIADKIYPMGVDTFNLDYEQMGEVMDMYKKMEEVLPQYCAENDIEDVYYLEDDRIREHLDDIYIEACNS
ncbi:hypothetical protein SAMN02745229_01294 [Butyrivibrio fibrisolvens DSM 3071]|uniref:Uncharacterized protein n=1 Tax=Butyrivibrio fibrisolvens DSM 3071 TaxID=1121131 RepID=A0A1M5X4Z7_BUTFI|nr:hypothetical protein [Butyrivibrio fibrisolvens]SHH94887.1 hypothetical protein SAMN02745229_01294 [Butyrivibrio fibrisolvens DSM 3071]